MVDQRQQIVATKAGTIKPIVLGSFTFTESGVLVKGKPSIEEFAGSLAFAERAETASQWWLADLLTYAHSRDDWEDSRDQIIEATRYSPETIRKYLYMGERFAPGRRRPNVDFSVHREVAALEPRERERILEVAETERMTVRDVRLEVRARQRRRIISGEAVLEGMFRVVYADFPWAYGNKQPSGSSSESHYPTMTVEEGCALPVREHVTENAVMFFWVPAPILPDAFPIITAWGFTYKTGIVWDKVVHNFGHYVSVRHEHLLICTRGSCTPENPTPMPDSVQTIRRVGEHSEKPEEFRKIIEHLYPTGPHLELFGRKRVENWTVFGNDSRLWAKEARA